MHVALCLVGKVGGTAGKDMKGAPVDFVACAKTHMKHIIGMNNCDVFIHSWSTEFEPQLREIYKPKKAIFEPQIQKFYPEIHDSGTKFRLTSARYSWKKCVDLKSQYEKENNFTYDWVMLCRFDILFFVPLNFNELDSKKFYLPVCNHTWHYTRDKILHPPGRINLSREKREKYSDVFCVGNSTDMNKFSTMFNFMPEYSGDAYKMTRAHLIRIFGKDFRKKVEYVLYRWYDFELYRWKINGWRNGLHVLRRSFSLGKTPENLLRKPSENLSNQFPINTDAVEKLLYKSEIIPVNTLCLDFRYDIPFRAFILKEQKWDIWEIFIDIPCNRKIKRYRYQAKFLKFYDSIHAHGQKKPIAVFVNPNNNKLYPLDGATRISSIIASGIQNIKVVKYFNGVPKNYWKKDLDSKYLLQSKLFTKMPESLMIEFQIWLEEWKKKFYPNQI